MSEPVILPYTIARTLDTVHRCPHCDAWTCAPRWQRVPHDCPQRQEVAS